jgi:hypothetical protein
VAGGRPPTVSMLRDSVSIDCSWLQPPQASRSLIKKHMRKPALEASTMYHIVDLRFLFVNSISELKLVKVNIDLSTDAHSTESSSW